VDRALPTLLARAAIHRSRTAVIDNAGAYSYADLLLASSLIADQLAPAKDREQDLQQPRVAFLVAPGFAHIAVQWGIWRAGAIAVPLPMNHPPGELEYLIRDAGASMVIADAPHTDECASIAQTVGARFRPVDELLPPRPKRSQDAVVSSNGADSSAAERRAMIVYTSGTTGRPKGVVTTHANITAQIESLTAAWEWTASDRTLLVLPLHHVHGIINVVCCALWSGALLEIHDRFDSEAAWERLASGELTVFTAVPTIYHRLIQSWEAATGRVREARTRGCRSMRLMMSGSAPLPRSVLDKWERITGHVLLERYGMTEVGMALSNPLRGERRPGFVGQPLPGVEARIVDGELQLRGPGVFSEYWHQPEVTQESFIDGWFRTGDVATVEDGDYRLLGRSSVDIIKSGGDKISALEVEEVLRMHPSIGECAVVGVEDLEWGQRVCCAVELRAGQFLDVSALREWARGRLAPYKIPKELVCVPRLPRNAMGKVVKPEVSTLFARPRPPERRET
jgi:malonyl-CoA/methylmalonyl-CoA synthetase